MGTGGSTAINDLTIMWPPRTDIFAVFINFSMHTEYGVGTLRIMNTGIKLLPGLPQETVKVPVSVCVLGGGGDKRGDDGT